jgi:hypothetical protein
MAAATAFTGTPAAPAAAAIVDEFCDTYASEFSENG